MAKKTRPCTECGRRATHGFPKEGVKRCTTHKEAGMVSLLTTHCSVCVARGVYKRASFGFKGCKPVLCSQHQLVNMVMVAGRYCEVCQLQGALHHATYRWPGCVRTRCATHREKGMVKRTFRDEHMQSLSEPPVAIAPLQRDGDVGDEWVLLSQALCKDIDQPGSSTRADGVGPLAEFDLATRPPEFRFFGNNYKTAPGVNPYP